MKIYIITYKDVENELWSILCADYEFADTITFLQENDCEIVEVNELE